VKKSVQSICFEPRWPVILEILTVILLLVLLRARVSLMPDWLPVALGIALAVPIAGVWLSQAHPSWLRIERTSTIVLSVIVEVLTIFTIGYMIRNILIYQEGLSGHQLLASSIGAWVTNVMVFSLLYWHMDRGGPEARTNLMGIKPDWHFPQADAVEETQPEWRPTYVDYLFLSFSTATAFSAADILPLTSRAKLLMMFESSVSLITLVVVASRAINVLGG
jgi:hypothetical protein